MSGISTPATVIVLIFESAEKPKHDESFSSISVPVLKDFLTESLKLFIKVIHL